MTITTEEGYVYEPWTNGYAVGFKATHQDGRVEYIYLNPSSADDDGAAIVFLYVGPTGDPEGDAPSTYEKLFVGDADPQAPEESQRPRLEFKRRSFRDVLCPAGIHSWAYEVGLLPPDTKCEDCGELYGYPD
jgi:hypothetical protein